MGNKGYVVITGHCIKCKNRREMLDIKVEKVKTKKGMRTIAHGSCKVCGTAMTKIMPKR